MDNLDVVRDLRLLCSVYKSYYNTGSKAFLRDSPAEIQLWAGATETNREAQRET